MNKSRDEVKVPSHDMPTRRPYVQPAMVGLKLMQVVASGGVKSTDSGVRRQN